MKVDRQALLRLMDEHTEFNQVDLIPVLEGLNVSGRDVYYESEADFLLENIDLLFDSADKANKAEILLKTTPKAREMILNDIRTITHNQYEGSVDYSEFKDDLRAVVSTHLKEC